jgi:serine protease DegQ
VSTVEPDSPAEAAGIRPGDLIVAFAGEPVTGIDDLQGLLTGGRIGDAVDAVVLRRDQRLFLPVTPRERSRG